MTDDDRTTSARPDDVFGGKLVDLPLRVPQQFMDLIDNVAQGGNLPPEALGLALLWVGLQHAEEVGPVVMGVQMALALQRGQLLAQLEAGDDPSAPCPHPHPVGGRTVELREADRWALGRQREELIVQAHQPPHVPHFVIARDQPDADRYRHWLHLLLGGDGLSVIAVGFGQGDFLLRGREAGIIHLVPGWDTRGDTIELAYAVSVAAESSDITVIR